MGWVTITFRDGRPPLHYGDDNPHRPRPVEGPRETARRGLKPDERWHDRHHDDPEVTEPGGNPYS